MIYTLIAYKPNSVDSCKGCVMDRYDSDFILQEDLTIDQLIIRLAEIRSYDAQMGELDYDTYYLPLDQTEYIENTVSIKVEEIQAKRESDKQEAELKKEETNRQAKTQEELALLKKLQEKYK